MNEHVHAEDKGGASDEPRWTGKLMDVNGRSGTVEIAFALHGKKSQWRIALTERDSGKTVLEGETDLEVKNNEIVMDADQELTKGQKVRWRVDFKPAHPGRYAKSAMIGRYDVHAPEDGPPIPLSSGVMIIWQFA